MYGNYVNLEELLGKTLAEVVERSHAELVFRTTDGETYRMYHEQDCCEYVSIEDIVGDLDDLIGSPITMAEEVVEDGGESNWGTSTWTFYKLATNKGYVTIRWFGESNGYYSESVDFVKEESE
jgi:hypothetical protein